MPEVILPCPACGSTDCECLVCTINADENQTIHFHMACNKCFTSGPIADDAESAKKLWNTLPRALPWTNEPPKVAGWYWCRVSKLYQPRLVEVYDSEDGLRFGSGDSWQEPPMSVESCGFEWAGPISPPIEI